MEWPVYVYGGALLYILFEIFVPPLFKYLSDKFDVWIEKKIRKF